MFYGIYADPRVATVVVRLTFGVGHDLELVEPRNARARADYADQDLYDRLIPIGAWSAPFQANGSDTVGGSWAFGFVESFAQSDFGRALIAELGDVAMIRTSTRTPTGFLGQHN